MVEFSLPVLLGVSHPSVQEAICLENFGMDVAAFINNHLRPGGKSTKVAMNEGEKNSKIKKH